MRACAFSVLRRSRQNAFMRSASSASASRACSSATVLRSPLAMNVTLTRVAPSAQSKRADFGFVAVRSRSWSSGSHCARSAASMNASNSRSTATGTVFCAVIAKPSARSPAARMPRVRS